MAAEKKPVKKSSADKKQTKTSAATEASVQVPLDLVKKFLEQQGEKGAASKLEQFEKWEKTGSTLR